MGSEPPVSSVNNDDHEQEEEDDKKVEEVAEGEDRGDQIEGEDDVHEDDETTEENETIPPSFVLTPLTDIITGIEDDTILFKHRAKLWHFESETRDWVDRGIGNMHVVQNNKDAKKMRIIMWQDPTGLLVLHSWITKDLEVKPYKNNQHLMWKAIDYSDADEPTPNVFLLKFKEEEKAAEFSNQIALSVKILLEDKADDENPETAEPNNEESKPLESLESEAVKTQEDLSKLHIVDEQKECKSNNEEVNQPTTEDLHSPNAHNKT